MTMPAGSCDLLCVVRRELMVAQARLDELRITERVLSGLVDGTEEPEPLTIQAEEATPALPAPERQKHGRAPWTDEETEILRQHWRGTKDGEEVARLLPGRSPAAVNMKGYGLRLHLLDVVDIKVNEAPEREVPSGDRRFKENRPPRQPRSFEEQLEAVRNGAQLVERVTISRPIDQTLGGVVGEIL